MERRNFRLSAEFLRDFHTLSVFMVWVHVKFQDRGIRECGSQTGRGTIHSIYGQRYLIDFVSKRREERSRILGLNNRFSCGAWEPKNRSAIFSLRIRKKTVMLRVVKPIVHCTIFWPAAERPNGRSFRVP